MLKRSVKKRLGAKSFSRWYWLPGIVALVLFSALAGSGRLVELEGEIYRYNLEYFGGESLSGDIAVIEVPSDWPSSHLQKLLQVTQHSRVVALLPRLSLSQNNAAREVIESRLRTLEETVADDEARREQQQTLRSLQQELNVAGQLQQWIKRNGNVVVAGTYESSVLGASTLDVEAFGHIMATSDSGFSLWPGVIAPRFDKSATALWPDERLRRAVEATALLDTAAVRAGYPLWVEVDGKGYPGMLLQLLRYQAGTAATDVEVVDSSEVKIGNTSYPLASAFRLYPYVAPMQRHSSGIAYYSLDEAIAAGAERFDDKTVIIGTAEQAYPLASALGAVLGEQLVTVPSWALWAQLGAVLLVALLITLLFPRMRLSTMTVTVVLLLLLLVNSEFLLLSLTRQWQPLVLPAVLLLMAYPLLVLNAVIAVRIGGLTNELSDANRQLGRLLQQQGELDLALEKFHRCQMDEATLEQLYHLGLDFERKRQFAKAVTTFQSINATRSGYRDVRERIERNQQMEQRTALQVGGSSGPSGTVIMEADGVQNPTLGHYEVERELGRGAMGLVYLGRDPRIGRSVAIKTMALGNEFEGTQLKEVKTRFFREAETAGRLNHPNIVHIYDVGEEQGTAYIAMDYLKGEHLGNFIKASTRLPIKEVLSIAIQVAEALDYAHKQSVVHRDIKPANIVYDKATKTAKVTDFGVASLTDSSKTKTGTVLGSPSYMSPEQVAGKKVDGRADIFSLGVTLFQLITSQLPFEADSLGSLMYKIANEQHPKPSKFRKGIPVCITRIINKCMQKDPAKRYQTGAELVAALERCRK